MKQDEISDMENRRKEPRNGVEKEATQKIE